MAMRILFSGHLFLFTAILSLISTHSLAAERPHIILVMADDMGWGQTGYRKHPVLKTPNLDAMAENGLRFDRFYAGAATCSPTRATVFTGRSNDRTGVQDHGYALRLQEKTLPVAMKEAGYITGHFGKWHLNGLRGPGVPVLASDERNPTVFGFTEWLSVTNFFDRDPVMSRMGTWEEKKGDSSEIIIDEALQFFERHRDDGKPLFTVVWYGSPHSPFMASEEDEGDFKELDSQSRAHYGELVAMDRSIGTLRKGLRDLNMAENTLIWFCSDNGGLPGIVPETVGGLRGFKGTIYEGGLRVPGIVEWPARISQPRVTSYPACTMDIFPTIAELVGLPESSLLQPRDGASLVRLLDRELGSRANPIPFRQQGRAALVDNRYKLLTKSLKTGEFELYDLEADPAEEKDIAESMPERFETMKTALLSWNDTVVASVEGQDYPEGKVDENHPEPRQWSALREYEPFLERYENSGSKGKKKTKKGE
jgi:arylsulfatase A-like enzyme